MATGNIEEIRQGSKFRAQYPKFAAENDFLEYVNALVYTCVYSELIEFRRAHLSYPLSEFETDVHAETYFRSGSVFSLKVTAITTAKEAAHPSGLIKTLNIFGPDWGLVALSDIIDVANDLPFVINKDGLGIFEATSQVNYDALTSYPWTNLPGSQKAALEAALYQIG